MANYNRVVLMGNLTRDPELRTTPNQKRVCNFTVAVNRRYRDQDDQFREQTSFIDCQAWAGTGQLIADRLAKGQPIHLEGRLCQDRWQDREGRSRTKLKVVVDSFQFIHGSAQPTRSASSHPPDISGNP